MEQVNAPTATAVEPRKRVSRLSRERLGLLGSLLMNRKATIGLLILLFFVVVAVFAPVIAPTRDPNRMVGKPHDPPSLEHLLGTSRQGQDIFTQLVWGARVTLAVGFATGTVVIAIAVVLGISAGYLGGWPDELLSLITNVVLVIPALPLIIVISGFIDRPGPTTIVVVLSAISWAYGARVLRSQTLTLRHSDFVQAARVVGEPSWRIVLFEILPNMTSLVASAWIGAVLYAVLTQATLEFIGLGNPNIATWGTVLYWAQNNAALMTNAWWTFVPPGLCIAAVGFALVLINYGIDEISNPRLRTDKVVKKKKAKVAA
jgi:peptide/nickel transport system permease protein